jgi:hypothetical protein
VGAQPRCAGWSLATSSPSKKAEVSWEIGEEEGSGCFIRDTYHWSTIFQILTGEYLGIIFAQNQTDFILELLEVTFFWIQNDP